MRLLQTWTEREIASSFIHPAPSANKYSRGKLTIIGGSEKFSGAVCLSAKAALRVGAGYVDVICAPHTTSVVQSYLPSAVARSWKGFAAELESFADEGYGHPQAVLIGPGFDSKDTYAFDAFESVVECACVPCVIDGGALTLLAGSQDQSLTSGKVIVLTPHFGEASRLAASRGIEPVFEDAPDATEEKLVQYSRAIAEAWQATVALKGSNTYIAQAGADDAYVMCSGTSVLAKAGTGDVLAGIVGGLVCQGMDAFAACIAAAETHAAAGRIAAEKQGDISAMAEDVLDALPRALCPDLSQGVPQAH